MSPLCRGGKATLRDGNRDSKSYHPLLQASSRVHSLLLARFVAKRGAMNVHRIRQCRRSSFDPFLLILSLAGLLFESRGLRTAIYCSGELSELTIQSITTTQAICPAAYFSPPCTHPMRNTRSMCRRRTPALRTNSEVICPHQAIHIKQCECRRTNIDQGKKVKNKGEQVALAFEHLARLPDSTRQRCCRCPAARCCCGPST